LIAFQCNSDSSLDSLLSESNLSKPCADLIAHLIEILKVDGFFYWYNAAEFHICQASKNRSLALVFTSKRWLNMPGADARVYTSKTSADLEQRRFIESVFAYGTTLGMASVTSAVVGWNTLYKIFAEKLSIDPSFIGGYSTLSCPPTEDCIAKVNMSFTDARAPVNFEIRRSDVAPYLFSSYPKQFSPQSFFGNHWDDLRGQSTVPDIESWIRENIFECGSASLAP
jgi:hypothetical protein